MLVHTRELRTFKVEKTQMEKKTKAAIKMFPYALDKIG